MEFLILVNLDGKDIAQEVLVVILLLQELEMELILDYLCIIANLLK